MTTLYATTAPETTVTPVAVTRYDALHESANIIHQMLDGSIAATLIGDRPASGTVEMIFTTDEDAALARTILGARSRLVLEGNIRPAFDMTFVRQGALAAAVHDEARDVWVLSVGFQEVPA